MYAASIARTSSFGRNGFCRHITSESSGDAETKSSVVIPDDRQIWNAFTHHPDDVETVHSLQKDIDDRKIEFGIFEIFQSCGAARGFHDIEWLTRSTMEIIARTSDWSSGSRMRFRPAYNGTSDLGQTLGHYSTCE